MKIDMHCHTRKIKKGDSPKREVDKDKFIKKVKEASVDIVAITNHNAFDIDQYNNFVNDEFDIWPGIELDVEGNESKGHCIVIVNPNEVLKFNAELLSVINASPDDFFIKLSQLSEFVKKFDSILICHYGKEPALSDNDISCLKQLIGDIPLFLEPSNLTSAGIFFAHNYTSIIGSDVQNWDKYEKYSFPELKMDIDSFEHFKLLIKKDPEIIKTFVDKKRKKEMVIKPFENNDTIKLSLYNDVNVFIGGKGTGKTKILEALEKQYNKEDNDCVASYFANNKQIKFESLRKIESEEDDFKIFNCDNCISDFEYLKNYKATKIEKISSYLDWIKNKKTIKKFGFANSSFDASIDDTAYKTELKKYNGVKKNIDELLKFDATGILSNEENKELIKLLSKIIETEKVKVLNLYFEYKALYLEEFTISKMKNLYQINKGKNSKPNNTGLLNFYNSCKNLHDKTNNIINTLKMSTKYKYKPIGELPKKGYIFVRKHLTLNPEEKSFDIRKNNVKDLRELYDYIKTINSNSFRCSQIDNISNLTKRMEELGITSVEDFVQLKGDIVKCNSFEPNEENVEVHSPSNGEQSVLLLNSVLFKEKEVYILDEPEMSVGHDYINNLIVPKIIELAKLNKTIIVSTHDANIAVRTLPFTTIYRLETEKGKLTYVGNPFNEKMVNIDDTNDSISWAKTCVDTLEGGAIAFKERGDSYGRENL